MARITITYSLDTNGDPEPHAVVSLRPGDFLVFNRPPPAGVNTICAQADGPFAELVSRDLATAVASIEDGNLIVTLTPP